MAVTITARLRLPDGREFQVRDDWSTPPSEPDSVEFYWSDGNMACDCNRARLLNHQHGLDLPERCDTKEIALMSLTVDGVEQLDRQRAINERNSALADTFTFASTFIPN